MKFLFAALMLFITTNLFSQNGSADSVNENTVLKIRKNITTEEEIKQMFGEPDSKEISADYITHKYKTPTANLDVKLYAETKKVYNFNYVKKTAKAEPVNKDTVYEGWRVNQSLSEEIADRELFIRLVEKVISNELKEGTFVYNQHKAHYIDEPTFKTVIGKFMKISWKGYSATLHTKLGYQLRAYFKIKIKEYKKLSKQKYYNGNFCIELIDSLSKPFYFEYRLRNEELPKVN